MSLLDDILNAAINENVAVSALLMKCRLLAHRLGHEEFKQWVVWELEGYPESVSVPDYRKVPTNLKMELSTFRGIYKNYPVPVEAIPEQIINGLKESNFRVGISSLEKMSTGSKGSILKVPRGDMAHTFQRFNQLAADAKLDGEVLDLWQEVSSGQIASICDAVCGRVLDFTEEIRKKFPNAGEMSGDSPTAADAGEMSGDSSAAADRKRVVNQILNTTVNKGGSVNMTGTAIDSTVINITAGDFGGLSKILTDKGLSPENIKELEEALEADNGGLGSNVKKWLGKMAEMATEGALKISVDSVMDAVKQYCGLG